MRQKIDQLSEKERQWIEEQLVGARRLVEIFVPEANGTVNLASLDKAFAAFLSTNESGSDIINAVINRIGIAFGQTLVDGIGLNWVIATDENGTDLAVYGLPGKADVLIYPANLVAKRWERREGQISAQVAQLKDQGPLPKGFLKRWFGKS